MQYACKRVRLGKPDGSFRNFCCGRPSLKYSRRQG
jgi:hypothetical protein